MPDGEVLRTFAILTTAANAEMRAVHGRRPVVLEEAMWLVWPGEEAGRDAAAVAGVARRELAAAQRA